MSGGRPEIPGGRSEAARKAGGEALYLQLATLMAGNSVEACLWALTRELGGFALVVADTPDEAKTLLQTAADDAKNLVDLNWDEHHAEARAAMDAVNGGTLHV